MSLHKCQKQDKMLLSEAQEVMLPLCQFVGQIVNLCNFREAIQAERVKRCVRICVLSILA